MLLVDASSDVGADGLVDRYLDDVHVDAAVDVLDPADNERSGSRCATTVS